MIDRETVSGVASNFAAVSRRCTGLTGLTASIPLSSPRNRYKQAVDSESDGECMESSYHEMEREEFISKKAGLLEDLHDIQREKRLKRKKKR